MNFPAKAIHLTFLLFFAFSFGQNNFQKVDSISHTTKYKGDLKQLVVDLTTNLDGEIDKTRAIYSWITDNIGYDYKLFNKGRKSIRIKCKGKNDCDIKKKEQENKIVEKVLRKRNAICSGYALLFKRMCDLARITCISIDGYVKTNSRHVGNTGILDHAWNAVIIDGQTYFLDLTWASGYCEKGENKKLKNFVKKKNDFYWFTPTDKFTLDHFPKDPDKVLNFDIKKDDYKNQPYIENGIIPFIELENPKQGIIVTKVNDSIVFKFKYSKEIRKLQINTNLKRNPRFYSSNKKGEKVFNQKAFDKQEYIDFDKINDDYTFSYKIEKDNLKYIEIWFDYNLKIKYLVKIEQK